MGLARPAGGLASFPPSYFFFLLVSQASFPILDRNLELVRFSVGLQGYGTGAPREPLRLVAFSTDRADTELRCLRVRTSYSASCCFDPSAGLSLLQV